MKAAWDKKPLGDVAEIVGGGTPSKSNPEFFGGNIPWATVRDMNVEVLSSTEHTITELGLANSSAKIAPRGEVIIATRVGLGKVCLLAQDTAINQDLRVVVPRAGTNINRRFLYYWFKSIENDIVTAGTGATVQGVKLPFVKSLRLPLPPLEEQQRIVAILDEVFERLDRAKANAEANLASAKELFEATIERVIGASQKNSRVVPLSKEFDVRDGTHDSPKYTDVGVPLVTSKNLKNGDLDLSSAKLISLSDYHQISKRSGVDTGDVLFAMIGTIGNPVVIKQQPNFAIKNVALFKPRHGRDGRLLRFLLLTRSAKERFKTDAKGATQKFVGLGYLRSFELAMPSISDEPLLIQTLEKIEDQSTELTKSYSEGVELVEQLRQSILSKAFAGELT